MNTFDIKETWQWTGFSMPTPRINDTGSHYLKKKISLALIFWTSSSWVGEYFVHVVGFYLNFAIFATWKSFQHGLINYIVTKAKCRNLKNWHVKGLCGRYLFVWGPLTHCIHPLYLFTQGRGWGVEGRVEPKRRLEGQQFTKLGQKYQHMIEMYLQSINTCLKVPLQVIFF